MTDRFVAFQNPYDSSATICNPSYTYQLGSVQTDLITTIIALAMQLFIGRGYIVSSLTMKAQRQLSALGVSQARVFSIACARLLTSMRLSA